MLIVCAGLYRAASTWMYNVARLMAGDDVYCGFMDTEAKIKDAIQAERAVVKIHKFDIRLAHRASAVLLSHRDPRTIMSSSLGLTKRVPYDARPESKSRWDGHMERIVHHLRAYDEWKPYAKMDMKYEDFIRNRTSAALEMWRCMEMPNCSIAWILSEVERLSQVERSGGDPVTLFWEGHRTRGAVKLTPRRRRMVERRFRKWMTKRGYL